MLFGLLTLITALTISAVAIYYSVAGLVAIFAAAALPIIIMGSALEIGKLVTAVWLHKYWQEAAWWLKTYLSIAVLVLMFITSMGIFGFLSKAHIEQTANAQEGIAQIEQIDIEIARQQAIVIKAEERILIIESTSSNNDAEIQNQINTEQQRIDSAYTRIQPAIDEQLAIITKAEEDLTERLQPLLEQAATIETTLSSLSAALANNEVRVAQGIVGARQDGSLGPNTSDRIQTYRETEENKRTALLAQVEQIRTAPQPILESARAEISRLRSIAEQQIADSDRLISRLREQLGTEDTAAIESAVAEQQAKVLEANSTIDTLTENKYTLQTEYRKLEAEVGPIKYLAEFVYGKETDTNMLEEAVRWVILLIIFVFDPLAVLLLIASQNTFEFHKRERDQRKLAAKLAEEVKFQKEQEEFERKKEEIISRNSQATEVTVEELPVPVTTVEENDIIEEITLLDDSLSIEQQLRKEEFERLDAEDENWKTAKQQFKDNNPDITLKSIKNAYINGKIDKLPWEETDGYRQNAEQSDNSLWNKINKGV